jgi:hypothetical protein
MHNVNVQQLKRRPVMKEGNLAIARQIVLLFNGSLEYCLINYWFKSIALSAYGSVFQNVFQQGNVLTPQVSQRFDFPVTDDGQQVEIFNVSLPLEIWHKSEPCLGVWILKDNPFRFGFVV